MESLGFRDSEGSIAPEGQDLGVYSVIVITRRAVIGWPTEY